MISRRMLLGTALATTWPGLVSAQAGKPSLKIAHSTWLGYAPLYVGRDKGFFTAEGVDVQPILIESSGDSLAALAAGRIDAVASTFDGFALFAGNGAALKVVLALDESSGGDGIVSRLDIADVAGLRGKRVAVQKGSVSQFLLAHALDAAGLKLGDLQIVDMKAGDAGAAFVAGRVDAAVTWQPWLGRAQATEFGKVLVDTRTMPGLIVDAIAVRAEIATGNAVAVEGLVRGWFRTIDYIRANPAEAGAIMGGALHMTSEATDSASKDLRFFGASENAAFFGGDPCPAEKLFEAAGAFYQQVGVLKATVPAAGSVASSFVRRASAK